MRSAICSFVLCMSIPDLPKPRVPRPEIEPRRETQPEIYPQRSPEIHPEREPPEVYPEQPGREIEPQRSPSVPSPGPTEIPPNNSISFTRLAPARKAASPAGVAAA